MGRGDLRRLALAGALAASAAFLAGPASAQEAAHGAQRYGAILFDELEYRARDGEDAIGWDAEAWYGGDYGKVVVETEGEQVRGEKLESAEVQLLYSRLVGYFWDAQAGVRYDFRPDPSRAYAVLGVQGLAPGFFELDLKGFLSDEGNLSARFEADYDLRVTQRLILQPRLEVELAAQDVEELGIGRGIASVEPGLRLRYEVTRKFAPYLGVSWERALGRTADFAREEGEDVSSVAFLAGARLWF